MAQDALNPDYTSDDVYVYNGSAVAMLAQVTIRLERERAKVPEVRLDPGGGRMVNAFGKPICGMTKASLVPIPLGMSP